MNPSTSMLATVLGQVTALAPALLMLAPLLLARDLARHPAGAAGTPMAGPGGTDPAPLWASFQALSLLALASSAITLVLAVLQPQQADQALLPGLSSSLTGATVALLVQLLGTVIGAFSARYLQGEPGQIRYVAALAAVLASVHLLLLADHWLVLVAAWAAVGAALQQLLCFYRDRPFALLAAHKKRIADRLADLLLIAAALLAWWQVGSGSLSDLRIHLAQHGAGVALQVSALCLVLAVILRTALLPVHGWLIQVMEAPTPVSALLHAGVVNLGGFVLIRLATLLEASAPARWLLVVAGLATAALAGLVMLTRISIKVRLAWSTVAQMGFMLLECGLGLYTLALLHLVGHSLYKAHAFLGSSSAVRYSRLQAMQGNPQPATPVSLLLAPLLAAAVVLLLPMAWNGAQGGPAWPWWWSAVLALAWAPLLWLPRQAAAGAWRLASGLASVAALTALASLVHALPLGLRDAPHAAAGLLALTGLGGLYLCLALLQWRPGALSVWRRWSYAGFYVDEFYTRLALRLWPARWASPHPHPHPHTGPARPVSAPATPTPQ